MIRVIADGQTVIEATDATYRKGYVGAWVFHNNTQIYVDDFQVTYFPVLVEPCFTTSATMGAAPFAVDFDASCTTSVRGVAAYDWEFGDGGTGSGEQVSHTLQFGGSYMVTLTVRDNEGNVDTATTTIEVFDSAPSFSDDFSRQDGPVDGWTVYSGSWNILSEQLTTTSAGGENWAWAGDPAYAFPANFTLTFQMSFAVRPAGDVGRHGGVMFCATEPTWRYSGTIDGYTVDWIDRAGDHGIRLIRVTNGVQTVLDIGVRDPLAFPDPPVNWEIVVEGQVIRVFGDGELLLEAVDSIYRRGVFGIWCWSNNQQIVFDNMDVTSPAVELGTEMTFDASCSSATGTPIQTWAWDFGDGTNGSGEVVTHTYAASGSHTTTLTITTQGGLSASTDRVVETFVPLESYSDDFERPDGSPSGWVPLSDNWALSGGALQVTVETAGIDVFCYAGDPPLRFRNFEVIEFDMEFLSAAPDNPAAVGRHAGVFIFAESAAPRGAQQNDGYGIDWIDRIDDHGYRIYRFDNGVQTVNHLAGTPGETEPGTHWRIEIDGDMIRLLVDGALKGEVVDPTYRMGHFSFWAYGGDPTTSWVQEVRFDNLVIGAGAPRENCSNGADEDGDQLIDCEDPDCASAPNCQGKTFYRADPNNDGATNITDGIYVLNFLFLGGLAPTCRESADPNNDGAVNITDGIYILNYLFLGGTAPASPGPPGNDVPCGPDTDPVGSPKDLGCATYTKC